MAVKKVVMLRTFFVKVTQHNYFFYCCPVFITQDVSFARFLSNLLFFYFAKQRSFYTMLSIYLVNALLAIY